MKLDEAIAKAIVKLAREAEATAIIVTTEGGILANLISNLRPTCMIIAVTPDKETSVQLNSVRSVTPVYYPSKCLF